jgi:hypothetical protein
MYILDSTVNGHEGYRMSEKSPKRSPTHFLSNQVWKSMEKVAQDVNKYLGTAVGIKRVLRLFA